MLVNSIGYQRMNYVNYQNQTNRNTNTAVHIQQVKSSVPFGLERFITFKDFGEITADMELAIKTFLEKNKTPVGVLNNGEGFTMLDEFCTALGSLQLLIREKRNNFMDPRVYDRLKKEGFIQEISSNHLSISFLKDNLPVTQERTPSNPWIAKIVDELD